MIRHRTIALILIVVFRASLVSSAAEVPQPEAHLGFRPGADFKLASWESVVDYFQKVDQASDRVLVRELGKTTEGRPYVVAFVSSAETIRDLDRHRERQRRLADPRLFESDEAAQRAVIESKTVVLITCTIHSTETASTFMAMDLLHALASRDDPATREVLDGTILILVPSANPDGIDKVARWYERSKGHPWEGSGMPELYHKYAGHDTNRDWFMLNLQETRLLTRLLYQEWFPTVLYDVHQMGSRGARMFVPPFHDPINPNLDPRLHQSIFLVGAHMANDLASAGKRGVLTHAMYDNWWNGGNRTTPQRHNIVGVLTEAASVKMATPIFLGKEDLRGADRGFPDHQPAVNFVDPWPGGWWRLRDVVDYELICARSVLLLAARYRGQFQGNRLALARAAIEQGQSNPPFAWIVPPNQRDPGTAAMMVRILQDTGIEVQRATAPFQAEGTTYPSGTWVLPAAQPHRSHLKDMLERQVYPARFTAQGKAEPPYDVAGWTLPLQLGVRCLTAAGPFTAKLERLDGIEPLRGRIVDRSTASRFALTNMANDDTIVLNQLLAEGIAVRLDFETNLPSGRAPAFTFPADAAALAVLDRILPTLSTEVIGVVKPMDTADRRTRVLSVRPQRIALYQPWVPSMDEGWTRLVLERFRIPYVTIHNAEVRADGLKSRFDTLILPSIEAKTLRTGYNVDETEPAYVGGLGAEGAEALRRFVNDGGTLICLEDSSNYAIEELGLPVKNVLKDVPTSKFYGPGSIVRVTRSDPFAPLTVGLPAEFSVYFDRSLAFEVTKPGAARVLARYNSAQPLESGWLLGPEKLQGKGALLEVPRGEGRVILFGFPPQHRGQPHGTFRLLFNALRKVE